MTATAAAVEAAEADLDAAKGAAMLADRKYRETLSAGDVDPVALTWARGKRDDGRNAVRDAEARLASARAEHAAALAAQRAEEAREEARVADEARHADHAARVAPFVADLQAALAVVDEAACDVMRVASVVLDPDVVMRAEHPDARARVVAAAHRAAPLVTAIARAELAGEDAAGAADALAVVDPSHGALGPARLAVAAISKPIIFEQVIKLAALVGRTDMPHAQPVGRARAAVAELAFSRKTGRWWGGDRAAREAFLRDLIPPAVDIIVPQVTDQIRPWAPRGPFFVNVGGTQLQEIDPCRPQLVTAEGEARDAFGEPLPPREQVIGWFALDAMEHELVPVIVAPYAEVAA